MEIELCGYKVLIDEEDLWLISFRKWQVNQRNEGYIYFTSRINGNHSSLHREIIKCPKSYFVDHINGNTLDNRKENLRVCTRSENIRNQKTRIDNTTGFKGVGYDKSRNKYKARIKITGKYLFLGRFESPDEAYIAYCKASKKYHGEFGRIE
jgi:hypothetical protein